MTMWQVTKIETYWVLADTPDIAEMRVRDGDIDPEETVFEVNP